MQNASRKRGDMRRCRGSAAGMADGVHHFVSAPRTPSARRNAGQPDDAGRPALCHIQAMFTTNSTHG